MTHKNLLTIGKLSELSGVHVKALRYYDRIGILPPTYLNEENGYRYYSEEHIYLVEIIKLCAELSIPLKELKDFIAVNGSIENISELADIGIAKVRQRILEFQKNLAFLEEMKKEIQRSVDLDNNNDLTIIEVPETDYWLEPYEGALGDLNYHQLMKNTLGKVDEAGLKASYQTGIAKLFDKGAYHNYLFIALKDSAENLLFNSVRRVPTAFYQTRLTTETQVNNTKEWFPDLFADDYEKVIFLLETITVQMDHSIPRFEIRCSLPK